MKKNLSLCLLPSIIFCALLHVWLTALVAAPLRAAEKLRVVLDSDTANEVDDMWAIVRAFVEPKFEMKALSSVQWTHRLSPLQTVGESQRLNEDLLRLLGRQDVPCPLGAEMIMGKPWGGEEPANSPAAHMIIRLAKALPEGRKLTVIGIGAATNIASAIKLSPEITPKLVCYILSARYDSVAQVWNKDEFNTRMDLNAANFLFNREGLELHVMPINVLFSYKFDLEQSIELFSGRSPLWDYVAARWLTHSPSVKQRVIWDLALMQAVIKPELAEQKEVLTPPENKQRKVWVYTKVDVEGMKQDWVETVEKTPRH
jgi:inosine-uridine nucleoside N-ribohydrolase